MGFLQKLGRSVGKLFFLNNFFKSTQKGQIWVHIPSFFSKNTQSEQNWVLSRPYFFYFYFWIGSVAEGNTTFFFLGLISNLHSEKLLLHISKILSLECRPSTTGNGKAIYLHALVLFHEHSYVHAFNNIKLNPKSTNACIILYVNTSNKIIDLQGSEEMNNVPFSSYIFYFSIILCTLHDIKGVLHPRPVFGLFLHFSQKLQHIGNK